jgi:trimethylamine--corrinoid protein Co-methyltransferase
VDQRIYDRYQMEVMLNHTTKPIVFVSPDFEGCVAAVEMCEAVAGGAEAFQRHPFATCYINVTSGLVANEEALQKCIYLAEKGLPQLWIPFECRRRQFTGHHCRVHGLHERRHPAGCRALPAGSRRGACRRAGLERRPYNLKTMVGNYVLADEQGVPTSMGKYYDLPVFGLGGCTDAKVLDHQAGMECTISLMTALLHGANIVHDVGFMDSGLQGSLQLQVMANETIGFLRAATRGVVVDDETLALDAIDEVGPTGSFLQHPHTMRHYKAPFYSKLFDKGPYSQWEKNGRLTLEDKAPKRWTGFWKHTRPTPLPEEVQEKIRAIVKREQEWIDGNN